MQLLSKRALLYAASASGVIAYCVTAGWLVATYEDPKPNGKVVIPLYGRFQKLNGSAYIAQPNDMPTRRAIEALEPLADTLYDTRSPVLVYEDRRQLGPAHSLHVDIANIGLGRYLHWTEFGILLSTSDNSDPNTNGRHYWVVVP